MVRFNTAKFAAAVKAKRGERSLRSIIGDIEKIGEISIATVSRVENGKEPDFFTFEVLCTWLNQWPGEFFDFPRAIPERTTEEVLLQVLLCDGRLNQETVSAFMHLFTVAAYSPKISNKK